MEPRRDIAPLREPDQIECSRLVHLATTLVHEYPDRPTDWFDWIYLRAGCPRLVGMSNRDLFEEWAVEKFRAQLASEEYQATAEYQYLRAQWEREG